MAWAEEILKSSLWSYTGTSGDFCKRKCLCKQGSLRQLWCGTHKPALLLHDQRWLGKAFKKFVLLYVKPSDKKLPLSPVCLWSKKHKQLLETEVLKIHKARPWDWSFGRCVLKQLKSQTGISYESQKNYPGQRIRHPFLSCKTRGWENTDEISHSSMSTTS